MKLNEFKSKFFSRPSIAPPPTLYVFESEDSADAWIECQYLGGTSHAYQLSLVIQSDMQARYTLKPEWCDAEIEQFYAVEPDVIVVVVEKVYGKRTET